MLHSQVHHRANQQRAGQHQGPADHLPAAHLSRQPSTFGIAQPTDGNRCQHQQVTGLNLSGPHDHCVHQYQCTAQRRTGPEGFRRSLMGQPGGIEGHAQGLQAIDQRAMGGRYGLHGPGGKHRKAQDNSQRHQA
ncbi:hypothetical protein D3C84_798330 [compost metagenome]